MTRKKRNRRRARRHQDPRSAPTRVDAGLLGAWNRFWYERSVEPERLVLFRVSFFGLLGIDLVYWMVEKAHRYGTGGFNVAHFDILDRWLPTPNATVHTVLYLVAGFLALRVAAGIAVRASLILLTAIYGYTYFSSLHDGYQHHYLIFWLLLLSLALRLEETGGIDAPRSHLPERPKYSWGASLLYAQVSIVYLFTALSKASEYWLNGWALEQQISTGWMRQAMRAFESGFGLTDGTSYALAARAVFAWQLLAAVSFVVPKLRAFACITGPLFHGTVELIGVEVRWFSYYMITIYYVLLFPESWFRSTSEFVRQRLRGTRNLLRRAIEATRTLTGLTDGRRPALTGAAVIGSALLGALTPFPGSLGLAVSLGALVLLAEVGPGAQSGRSRTLPRLATELAFSGLIVLVPRHTDSAYNYYRYLGGDLSRRGDTEGAIRAYERAIELKPGPDSRHKKLAELLLRVGRASEAVTVYERARKLDPSDREVLAGLALALERTGQSEAAGAVRSELAATGSNERKIETPDDENAE